MELQEILDELAHQLNWRGPSGRVMGHIVLSRSDAVELVREVCAMRLELHQVKRAAETKPCAPPV